MSCGSVRPPRPPKAGVAPSRSRSRARLFAGVAGLLLVGAIGAGWWLYRASRYRPTSNSGVADVYACEDAWLHTTGRGLVEAPRLSIVVLPFESLSDDPKDDYLAEARTEDVTTDISRVAGMFVIARGVAYTYRGKASDVRKVGEELGVRYILEGSVRKLGDTLRVNAQLIATETAAHLWADRFDQQLKDIGAGQEEIARRISRTPERGADGRRERPQQA